MDIVIDLDVVIDMVIDIDVIDIDIGQVDGGVGEIGCGPARGEPARAGGRVLLRVPGKLAGEPDAENAR